MNRRHWALLLLATVFLTGCYDQLYHGLSERAANEMLVALQQSGLDADKVRDDRDPEAWVVRVPGGTHVEAIHVLEGRGLPRPEIEGFSAFYPGDGLVPTASEERVLLQYATAQEIRRSLIAIDGVLDAHVNLVLADSSRFGTAPERPARASVVIRYDANAKAPLAASDVQKIVAGGVERLGPDAVQVLLTPSRDASAPLAETRLAQVGPIAVPTSSQTFARVVFAAMTMLILGLGVALVLVLVRRRRS